MRSLSEVEAENKREQFEQEEKWAAIDEARKIDDELLRRALIDWQVSKLEEIEV